jgi:hypothetical protein
MTRETTYFVQAFNAGKGGNLKADTPIACKSATGAVRTAERLALSKLGVVAFSSTGDAETVTMMTSRPSYSAMANCPRPLIDVRNFSQLGFSRTSDCASSAHSEFQN